MSESSDAATRRADYARALREERDGYARVGRTDRVAEVEDELARVEGRPLGRSEDPVEPKPRTRTRKP
jgi:hypothetical protein